MPRISKNGIGCRADGALLHGRAGFCTLQGRAEERFRVWAFGGPGYLNLYLFTGEKYSYQISGTYSLFYLGYDYLYNVVLITLGLQVATSDD